MNGYNRPAELAGNNVLLLAAGWISAVISLFLFPFIFGAAGVVSGILSTRTSNRAGLMLIVTSMVFMTVGVLFKGILLDFLRYYAGI